MTHRCIFPQFAVFTTGVIQGVLSSLAGRTLSAIRAAQLTQRAGRAVDRASRPRPVCQSPLNACAAGNAYCEAVRGATETFKEGHRATSTALEHDMYMRLINCWAERSGFGTYVVGREDG